MTYTLILFLALTACSTYQQPCQFKQFLTDPSCR